MKKILLASILSLISLKTFAFCRQHAVTHVYLSTLTDLSTNYSIAQYDLIKAMRNFGSKLSIKETKSSVVRVGESTNPAEAWRHIINVTQFQSAKDKKAVVNGKHLASYKLIFDAGCNLLSSNKLQN